MSPDTQDNSEHFADLNASLQGDCSSDAQLRGLYATDASVYQVMPKAVVHPRNADDIATVIKFASENALPVLPRGAGTSQNGQTVNDAIVLDNSRYFNQLLALDVDNARCTVEPGMVLDTLNRQLKPHGLWFPVDVSTASRATIGGMAGNNSCGQRSIVYGTMRHNVESIDAFCLDGQSATASKLQHFGQWQSPAGVSPTAGASVGNWTAIDRQIKDGTKANTCSTPDAGFVSSLVAMASSLESEIDQRFPSLLRRVGGYNLDALLPDRQGAYSDLGNGKINLSHLLVGSEGTLGVSSAIELKLAPLPGERVVGVCHFPTFYQAMDAAQHLVLLNPSAIELMDATMIELAMQSEAFRPVCKQFVRAEPAALLLVEFATGSQAENRRHLSLLADCMAELGLSWDGKERHWGGVIEIESADLQAQIGEVRKSGLNIMMSMKSEGKPVSFVEDCAVALPDLAEYTAALTRVFEKHNTRGTWYAHASVGCLHVRPVLNLKLDKDRQAMRTIAEEAFALVRQYKGSHSGEHGDGISRSEFHTSMFGEKLVSAFEDVKSRFDPDNLLNPGRIVHPPRMNERRLLRYHDNYSNASAPLQLAWSDWPEAAHGLQGAVEMCNNNGACRKLAGGVMCPSYRATRDEKHVTRGRANTLRLALSGQFEASNGTSASNAVSVLASDELHESLKFCVSCKACKRECPTGVDMARMKIEVLAARHQAGKQGLQEWLVAELPANAYRLSRFSSHCSKRLSFVKPSRWLNKLQRFCQQGPLGPLFEKVTGFSRHRPLPSFADQPFTLQTNKSARSDDARPTVILFADTFNRYFDPHILDAAVRVLEAAGYRVTSPDLSEERPLCCGRTYLACGRVSKARDEMQRTRERLLELLAEDDSAMIVGLEPSCMQTFHDEMQTVLPDQKTTQLASRVQLFEDFLEVERQSGRLDDLFDSLARKVAERSVNKERKLLLHGHCHQKAFAKLPSVQALLNAVPGFDVSLIETSCCGMAGSFGYNRETADVSLQMAELDLFPALRQQFDDATDTHEDSMPIVVADGTSCRAQIQDGLERQALHVAEVLDQALHS